MVELVDAQGQEPCIRKDVRVQVSLLTLSVWRNWQTQRVSKPPRAEDRLKREWLGVNRALQVRSLPPTFLPG